MRSVAATWAWARAVNLHEWRQLLAGTGSFLAFPGTSPGHLIVRDSWGRVAYIVGKVRTTRRGEGALCARLCCVTSTDGCRPLGVVSRTLESRAGIPRIGLLFKMGGWDRNRLVFFFLVRVPGYIRHELRDVSEQWTFFFYEAFALLIDALLGARVSSLRGNW